MSRVTDPQWRLATDLTHFATYAACEVLGQAKEHHNVMIALHCNTSSEPHYTLLSAAQAMSAGWVTEDSEWVLTLTLRRIPHQPC